MVWRDRQQAGQKLAERLEKYRGKQKAVVLGLPRGGVVTAYQVARYLDLPLDIIVTRKIGAPDNEEYAIGAIDETGAGFFNDTAVQALGAGPGYLKETVRKEKKEAERRLRAYRAGRPPLDLTGATAIIVDDGVATGYTMRAALHSCRKKNAGRVIAAAPVIAPDTIPGLKALADEVVCLETPENFGGVGQFYADFSPTTDEKVLSLLSQKKQ